MNSAISKRFNGAGLLKFTMPTVIMMVFLSMYSTVDGAFVAKLVSEDALSAINIVYPLFSVFFAISLMLSTGANAIIATSMGESNERAARRFLSLIYIVGVTLSVVLAAVTLIFQDQLLTLLGCTPRLEGYARTYLRYMVIFEPLSFLQIFTQTFFVTAGKPRLSLLVIIIGGVANVVLDYVFIAVFQWGMAGAAIATGIGFGIPGLYGIWFFMKDRGADLCFEKPKWEGRKLLNSCFNGSSELVNNLSVAVTTYLFNMVMLKYMGEKGVAAISVILYIQFVQAAIYYGYASGVAPVISYKHGEDNRSQIKTVISISIKVMMFFSVLVIILSVVFADSAVSIFVQRGSETFDITKRGLIIFSSSYLFMGMNVFICSMFTAFGNGQVSAILSLQRTLLFLVGALLLLPKFFEVDGVWVAVPVAEALSLIVSMIYFLKYRKKYHY